MIDDVEIVKIPTRRTHDDDAAVTYRCSHQSTFLLPGHCHVVLAVLTSTLEQKADAVAAPHPDHTASFQPDRASVT
jgi:hypothetical protein